MNYVVYTATDATGTILYIGYTQYLTRRLAQHRKRNIWFDQAAAITTIEFPTKAEAREYERRSIKAIQPPHNIVHTVRHLNWERPPRRKRS